MTRMEIINTKRLRLFRTRMRPTDHNMPRDVWLAFRTDEDRPMVCATAVVMDPVKDLGYGRTVDWLEVASEYRRMGFATEMLGALRRFYKPISLEISAGSEAGEKFITAIEDRWKAQLI